MASSSLSKPSSGPSVSSESELEFDRFSGSGFVPDSSGFVPVSSGFSFPSVSADSEMLF
jgi:hypothetical protein